MNGNFFNESEFLSSGAENLNNSSKLPVSKLIIPPLVVGAKQDLFSPNFVNHEEGYRQKQYPNLPILALAASENITNSPEQQIEDEETLSSVINEIGLGDVNTMKHCVGLTHLIRYIAENYPKDSHNSQVQTQLTYILYSGLLHDLGKRKIASITNSPRILKMYYPKPEQEISSLMEKYGYGKEGRAIHKQELLASILSPLFPEENNENNLIKTKLSKQKNIYGSVRHTESGKECISSSSLAGIILEAAKKEEITEEKIRHILLNQKNRNLILQIENLGKETMADIVKDIIKVDKIAISKDRKIIDIHPIESFDAFLTALKTTNKPISVFAMAHLFGGIFLHHAPFSNFGYPSKETIEHYYNQVFGKLNFTEEQTQHVAKIIENAAREVNILDILHAVCFDKRDYQKNRTNIEPFLKRYVPSIEEFDDPVSSYFLTLFNDGEVANSLQQYLLEHDDLVKKMNSLDTVTANGEIFFSVEDLLKGIII